MHGTAPLDAALLQGAPNANDTAVGSMLTWQVDDVIRWLQSIGLAEHFEKQFREHQITGDILPLLTISELKDMGVNLVGPRATLLRQLGKLRRAYVNYQRNKPLWQGLEQRYTNPCECIGDYVMSCGCPDPPDKYALTSSHMKLTHKVYPLGRMLRCCSKGQKIHTIDLSLVADVDSSSQETCCGGRDQVRVEHEKEGEGATLYLPVGEGPNLMRMIRDAVEETQEKDKLNVLVG